jgi:putative addiction module component (TIGR02574 family)
MSRDLKDIAAEALDLPLNQRAELADRLLESLDDLTEAEAERLWAVEAERRYVDYKAGKIGSVPSEEVFERLRARRG